MLENSRPRNWQPAAGIRLDLDLIGDLGIVAVYVPRFLLGDVVRRKPWGAANTVPVAASKYGGSAWVFTGTAIRGADISALGAACTLACIGTPQGGTLETMLSVGASGGSDNWHVLNANGNISFDFQSRTGGTIGTAASAASWRFIRAAYSGSATASNSRAVYVNGKVAGTDTTTVAVSGADRPVIGGLWRASVIQPLSTSATVELALVANRGWSAAEHAAWARKPWQIFRARRVWVPGSAANAYTLTITQGSYALTGNNANLAAARRLAITQGSYTLTGNNAGLAAARRLAITQGSYSLTGSNAGLVSARKLAITQGSYALTGNNLGLAAGRRLAITQGAYALTGNSLGLVAARRLAITQGSYSLTGNDVTLTKSAAGGLQVTQGAYTLTGNAVQFAAARRLAVTQGSYALTGQSIGLVHGRAALQITQGTYTLTAQDVQLRAALRLSITTGLYALTGSSVSLLYANPTVVRAAISPARLRLDSGGAGRPRGLPTGRRPT